jgi:hypothetical protein
MLPEEVGEFIEALHRVIWKCRPAPKALTHAEKIIALRSCREDHGAKIEIRDG